MGEKKYEDALQFIEKAEEVMETTDSEEVTGRFYFYKPTFKRHKAIATSIVESELVIPDDLTPQSRFAYLCQIADKLLL